MAHGEFLDLVNDGGLAHLDQPPLTAAVRAAQQRPLAGAQAWDRRRWQVDQSPLVAATLAVLGVPGGGRSWPQPGAVGQSRREGDDVRLSVVLLVLSLLGVLGGGWLIGRLGFGLCVIADSVAVAAWALLRDDGGPAGAAGARGADAGMTCSSGPGGAA